MRIVVYGAGGVGSWLGARLQEAGAEVIFIARGAHGEALRERGLRLEVGSGDNFDLVVLERVRAFPDSAAAKAAGVEADVCLLCVKAAQVREAAEACRELLAAEGFAVTTQNGLEAPDEAAAALGARRVVGGSCKLIGFVESPGVAKMVAGIDTFTFGEVFDASGAMAADARSERVDALRMVVSSARGITVQVGYGSPIPSMWLALWEKAVIMCCLGPVGALTRASMDAIGECPETRALLKRAMLEVLDVAEKSGFRVAEDPEAHADRIIAAVSQRKGETSSTCRDVVTGKPSEINELSGAIVRCARKIGASAPTHELILAALLPQERRARGELVYGLNGVPRGAPHVPSL